MSFHAALPPWLQKAVEQAGDATVILKPGDRPFVIRSKSPYHLGTQPLTNMAIEGLAQQILSEDGQQALYNGTAVEETLGGTSMPVDVHALRLDNEVVIKLRKTRNGAADQPAPPVDEIALAIEEETRIIKRRVEEETLILRRGAAQPATAPPAQPAPETPTSVPDTAPTQVPSRPFVVQNAGGEAIVQNASGEAISEIELPLDEQEVDTFIARLSPAPTAAAAPKVPLATQGPSEAERRAKEEEEAARRAQEAAARRAQEEAARLAQEEAARHEQEEAERRPADGRSWIPWRKRQEEEEEAARRAAEEAAQREQEEAARRAAEEAAQREQEEAARRAAEEAAQREQEEAARRAAEEAAQREQEEAARRAAEEAAQREQEEAARRAAEEAAQREQEEAARRAAEEAAQREQEEAARRAAEEAAQREQEEAARRAAEEAAQREQEEAARRAAEEAAQREQEEAARRAAEEAAQREQEEAARRAAEEAAQREQEEAARRAAEEAARREQEEATRRAAEEAAQREQEEAARRAAEEAAQREQEEAARRAAEEAARREQEEAARLAQEAAARREQEEAARLAQEAAARREQEEAARLAQKAAARREQEEARLAQEASARREREKAARARVEQDDEPESTAAIERAVARATVLDLSAKRRLAVATTELTDWIIEAMDRGATALYLRAGKVPSARIDGQVEALASEPLPMSMFERAGALMMSGEEGWRSAGEWAWSKDVPGSGSVHCQAFSDGQGGGFIVQLPVSVAGLDKQVPPHIRAACETGEGLVVIAAPFAEDMVAMVGAVVSWNAHRRPGFVVAFGAGGGLQAIAGNAFISERALPATDYDMGVAVQNALRERPDVVVVAANDSLPGADALVAAAVGRLVIVGVVARTAPRAVEVVLKNVGPNRKALATAFRGACSWRGFRRPSGSRVVIADALFSNEHVAALIEAADIGGLHSTQNNREDGMRALDSALAAAVTRRRIGLREAAACAVDRKALIALVRRQAREARATKRAEQRAGHRAPVISMTGA